MTFAFYPLMVIWTIGGLLFAPLLFPLVKALTGWKLPRTARFLVWIHGRGLLTIVSPFVRLERDGLEKIPLPCVLVANHLSFLDGYYMSAMPFFDVTFAVARWPFRMFWYTAMMRLSRYLDVERTPFEETVAMCRQDAADKGCIMFFPEGHRTRTGELQSFHSGAFRIAAKTGLPVVPLCITGTNEILPPGRYYFHPAKVRLKALPPIDPATYGGQASATRLKVVVREIMEKTLDEMRRENTTREGQVK